MEIFNIALDLSGIDVSYYKFVDTLWCDRSHFVTESELSLLEIEGVPFNLSSKSNSWRYRIRLAMISSRDLYKKHYNRCP